MVIKRVGPLSCAKIAGTLYACLGLLFGAIVSVIALAGSAISGSQGSSMLGGMFGLAAIILLPILYGGLGFVIALIMGALYNFVAGMVGGIELDVQ